MIMAALVLPDTTVERSSTPFDRRMVWDSQIE
jgi:hypothetical protein